MATSERMADGAPNESGRKVGHGAGQSIRASAMLAALLGAIAASEPMPIYGNYPRATRRPPGNRGIKAYRAKRRRKNRIASRSRARNRS